MLILLQSDLHANKLTILPFTFEVKNDYTIVVDSCCCSFLEECYHFSMHGISIHLQLFPTAAMLGWTARATT